MSTKILRTAMRIQERETTDGEVERYLGEVWLGHAEDADMFLFPGRAGDVVEVVVTIKDDPEWQDRLKYMIGTDEGA